MAEIDNFINSGIVSISADPISGLKRQVILDKFSWNQSAKTIVLNCTCKYLDNTDNFLNKKRLPDYGVDLKAANDVFVDKNTGEFVNSDDINAIGEYDYFIGVANNPINIFQMIFSIIKLRDQVQKKFDI